MEITRFAKVIPGPEAKIETFIASWILNNLPKNQNIWVGASASIGSGRPDFIIVSYHSSVSQLSSIDPDSINIITYLHSKKSARMQTIADKLRKPQSDIIKKLLILENNNIIRKGSNSYSLNSVWKEILTDITTIEVKVSDYTKVIKQAARNQVIAHRSFIALPEKLAKRAVMDKKIIRFGIGVIQINNLNEITVLREPKFEKHRIPHYYYKIAQLVAIN